MNAVWVVPIAVPLVFALFRRLYPARPKLRSSRSLEDLRAEFGRWHALGFVMFLVFAPLTGLLWWGLFVSVFSDGGFMLKGATYTLRPGSEMWAIPAIFLSIVSAGPPSALVYRWRLKGKYDEFQAYLGLKYGYDPTAASRLMYLAVGTLSAVGVAALANWYAVFSPSQIVLDNFLSLRSHAYRYEQLASIQKAPAFVAPNGDIVRRLVYELRFDDGTSWNTEQEPSEASGMQIAGLMKVVSQRSGVPVVGVSVLK